MSKKRSENQAEETTVEVADPFTPDMSKLNAEFNLDDLIKTCREKMAEASKVKIPITERIQRNRDALERIKRTIAQLEVKASQAGTLTACEYLIRPIAEQLQGIYPNAFVEIMAPNSLTGTITVTISKKTTSTDKKLKGLDGSKAITFVLDEEGLMVKDFSQNSQTYPPGSLPDICLENFKNIRVPTENPVEFLLNYLR